MERLSLYLTFVILGWSPLLLGIYFAHKEDFAIAMVCLLISCVGFRQIFDNINFQQKLAELKKEFSELIKKEDI